MQVEQSWQQDVSLDERQVDESWSVRPILHTIAVLFKLRIVMLLLLSAYGGAILGVIATGQTSGWGWVLLTFSGLFASAGASAINQYLERHRDAKMVRTAKRPLAIGKIRNPHIVLWVGVGLVVTAVALSAAFNLALAFWVGLGAVIYVGVYTIWLKPRTTLNIVIGGAAGSCAVLSGGAAMNAWQAPSVWLLAILIFVWTPVHFWALALAYREDYQTAAYPMLPAQVSPQIAARWTAFHTVWTVACGIGLGISPVIDWWYLTPVTALSVYLVYRTWMLLREPTKRPSLALFHASNLYLTLVLLMLLLTPFWR